MAATSGSTLEAVVLAAGLSRRAGVFKPAFAAAGRPLLRHAVDGLRPWCRRVVVVTGHARLRTEGLVAGLEGVATVHNPRFDGDMFLSVQAGAAALAPDTGGFFVLPADCPFVGAEVYAALVAAFGGQGGARAVVPAHGGRGGHPVLLPAAARGAILAAAPGATLRTVIRAHDPLRLAVASPAVLADLDTPGDLAGLGDPEA
ncbi:MAG: nucleotidyltransferase family protein [Candidatus Krumholzibacteriia bacterium]